MLDTHTQKLLVINNRELKYKGIFRADELFSIINRALETKGYEKREKKSEELVTAGGKKVHVELRPFKEKNDYTTLMIKIKITLDNITEKVEVIHDTKRKYQNGDVLVVFDAWVLTDWEHRWVQKPWAYFLKASFHKFVYRLPHWDQPSEEVGGDTAYVYAQIKALLSSYKPEAGKEPKEKDILKQVEADIQKEMQENEQWEE